MIVTQRDLDSFHDFATHLLAQAGQDLSLEEIIDKWHAEREHFDTVASIRRGIADAEAGRVRDLREVDSIIRTKIGFPPRG